MKALHSYWLRPVHASLALRFARCTRDLSAVLLIQTLFSQLDVVKQTRQAGRPESPLRLFKSGFSSGLFLVNIVWNYTGSLEFWVFWCETINPACPQLFERQAVAENFAVVVVCKELFY
jgi:hypothetical protein